MDMCMCLGNSCPSKEKCYRYTGPSNPYAQAYMDYDAFRNKRNKKCKSFIKGESYAKPKS